MFMEQKTGKRPLRETEYAGLEQALCFDPPTSYLVSLDAEDLSVLRGGEAAFCWESPRAASREEAEALARRAVREMAPEPGQKLLAAVLHLIADAEWSLDEMADIAALIHDGLGQEDISFCYALNCGGEGTRFALYTAEGGRVRDQ